MRRNWLSQLFRPHRVPIRKRARIRAGLEGFLRLEDRTVPAVNILDLTAGIGESGVLNTATFTAVDPQPTGTGVIDPFVRIQRSPSNPSGMEHGYNTDGIEEFDTKDAGGHNWNHSLKLAELQDVNGFYQFTLDVNETKPGALISLDELQVFVQGAPNLTGASFNADGTITSWKEPRNGNGFRNVSANLVYDMDAGAEGNSSVLLNYFLNHGSGSGDMTVLIPKSLFPALRGQQYVYLYSKFGQDVPGAGTESGFEEWTARLGKGQVGPFSLSGHKFEDLTGDQNIVGDPVLPGWEIKLYKETDKQPGLTAGDTFVGSDTTDANGFFEFTNLAAGETYYTVETQQTGWIQTYGGNLGNAFYTTLLNSDVIDIDFGNFEMVDISGKKVADRTGDGVTGDDTGLGGVTINLFEDANGSGTLDAADGGAVQTTTTAANGTYAFTDLGPGTYFVKEVVPAGYVQTGGPAYYTVDVGGGGVQSGGAATGKDFANFELFDIRGEKYRDISKDGAQGADEPLLSGWTIFLDGSNGGTVNGILDAGERSTVTGANGAYAFTDLGPGTYIVREVQKSGWSQTSTNPPPISGLSGVNVDNVDFGNVLDNPGIGHTKGYWHNQNGAATIAAMGGWDVVKHELQNLYLRNEDGTLFNAKDRTLAEFQDWITRESNASNMVSQLSAQAAASYLNARAGSFGLTDPEGNPFAVGETLVSVPTAISSIGMITVDELLDEARRILHGNNLVGPPLADYDLIDPSPARTYAGLLMSALDAFNNSLNIIDA